MAGLGGLLGLLLAGACAGAEPTPQELARQVRSARLKVRDSVVAIGVGRGSASGVVVSEDGWVLTAGHVVAQVKKGKRAKVFFEDGRRASAEVVGWDLASDLGMLRIIRPAEGAWSAVSLAERSPEPGAFCFTLAHPSGRVVGRPAQLRIGRVRAKLGGNDPNMLISDCEIQPGDSGGPLFDTKGRLIGIDSSAGTDPGYNQFAVIERYHAGRERLRKGGRWGDRSKGPAFEGELEFSLDEKTISSLGEEMQRRLMSGHLPTTRFVEAMDNDGNEVEITPRELARLMSVEAVALAHGAQPHIGLDDPLLLGRLPAKTGQAAPPIEVRRGGELVCMATPVGPRTLVSKLSEVEGGRRLMAHFAERSSVVRIAGTDRGWDLAFLKAEDEPDWKAVKWPDPPPAIIAGDLLVALDSSGNLLWNVATDRGRPVSKKRSVGPLRDEKLISERRAPYPIAIRHALPLYAMDAGTPVYDEEGAFVGMHAARFSRTLGLIIPADVLRERVREMER